MNTEKAKKLFLVLVLVIGAIVLLISGLFTVISGTVGDLAPEPPAVPAQDRVAFWYPYIQHAVQASTGLKDPIQLVDSIINMGSTGNPTLNAQDGKAVGLMWVPQGDGSNLDDPQTNITTGVNILGDQRGDDNESAADYWFSATSKEKPTNGYSSYSDQTIFDVWIGNGSQASDGSSEYKVDGTTATVLAIAQGPDGTSTSSVLSTKENPVEWPTIRLPDYVEPVLPPSTQALPQWAQEVSWSKASYGPADPSGGNYILYPGMYVYQIQVTAKDSSVKSVTIPFWAVWTEPTYNGSPVVYASPEQNITIDFNGSSGSGGGGSGSGGGGTVYTSPNALQYKPVDPTVIASYLARYDSAFTADDIATIISAAKAHGLNPLLLIAITGQEQSFDDVNNGTPEDVYRIEQNPFNVDGSWQDTDYPLAVSADIVANFLAERLSTSPPSGVNAVEWINDSANPVGGLYASEPDGSPTPGWWEGVNYFFSQMNGMSGMYVSQPSSPGETAVASIWQPTHFTDVVG